MIKNLYRSNDYYFRRSFLAHSTLSETQNNQLQWKTLGIGANGSNRIKSNRHSWEVRNDSLGPNLSQSRLASSDDRPKGPSGTCQSLFGDFRQPRSNLASRARTMLDQWRAIVISLPFGLG